MFNLLMFVFFDVMILPVMIFSLKVSKVVNK